MSHSLTRAGVMRSSVVMCADQYNVGQPRLAGVCPWTQSPVPPRPRPRPHLRHNLRSIGHQSGLVLRYTFCSFIFDGSLFEKCYHLHFHFFRLTVGNCQNNIARKRKLQKVLMNLKPLETKCWNFDLYSSTIHSITASQDLCWQILATAAGDAPRMLSPAAAAPRSAGPGPGEARHGAHLPRAGQARTWWDCWVIQT